MPLLKASWPGPLKHWVVSDALVSCDTTHAFAKAAHDAFYKHYPLIIRPDDIWFCIVQGFSAHVNQNVEALRDRLVSHAGQQKLIVDRPDFGLGKSNPWSEVFSDFSTQIRANVGKAAEMLMTNFSTSTSFEQAAFDVCLMDGFQGYFEYEVLIGCGIPEITVLGSPDDWLSMIPRVAAMAEYGLEAWVKVLLPVLQQIADTAAGRVDKDFWLSFFRYESGSGPAELTGWILTLFPYLIGDHQTKALIPNPYFQSWHARYETASSRSNHFSMRDAAQGPSIWRLPGSLASAPVRFVDARTNVTHDMRFVAGPIGVAQHPESLALRPVFGWAVVHDVPASPPPSREEIQTDIDEVTGKWRGKVEPT